MKIDYLAQTLHSTQPLSSDERIWLAILVAAQAIKAQQEQLFRSYGLTATQYNVLRILRGGAEQGMTCGEIAERVIDHDPDITRLLDRCQRAAWVERWRDPDDRRSVRSRLSETGLQLVTSLDQPVAQMMRDQLAGLSAATSERLGRDLTALLGTINQ